MSEKLSTSGEKLSPIVVGRFGRQLFALLMLGVSMFGCSHADISGHFGRDAKIDTSAGIDASGGSKKGLARESFINRHSCTDSYDKAISADTIAKLEAEEKARLVAGKITLEEDHKPIPSYGPEDVDSL